MRENLILFATKCDDFCMKVWRFFQGNPPTFTEKFNGFSREFRRFLHESLMVFTGTFDDFSRKLNIFAVKSADSYFQPVHVFFVRIILIQAKLVRFCCCKSSNFLVKIAKFSWRICQIFLQTPSNFSAITYRQIFL